VSHCSETLTGIQTIRAFDVQQKFILENNKKIDGAAKSSFMRTCVQRWFNMRMQMLGAILVFSSTTLILSAKNTIATGIAGYALTNSISVTQTLQYLISYVTELESSMNCVERVSHYAHEIEVEPNPTPSEEIHNLSNEWPQGEITFDNYSMRYRPDLPLVLKNLSFTIKKGEKVGIVGRTGSGKSSTLLAIYRLVEAAEGSISIDDINIRDLTTVQLRSKISIIPQEPALFQGTIRSNLDPFDEYSDVQLWSALEKASMKDAIDRLESGLDTEVVSGGSNFSVGERQLLCLSRALVRNSKVIILDEATASVDVESDAVIQRTIREQFENVTTLTIAHRLNTIIDYDRVLVLSNGEIEEFDSPASLLANTNGMFYSMAKKSGLVK